MTRPLFADPTAVRVVMNVGCVISLLLAAAACCAQAGRKKSSGSQLRCYEMVVVVARESYQRPVQRKPKKDCSTSTDCNPRIVYKTAFRKTRTMKRAEKPILVQSLQDIYQEIESPRYPHTYLRNYECEWSFVLPRNHVALISFTSFNVEESVNCMNDYLSIIAGSKEKRFCGFKKKLKMRKIKNRRVKVIFRADSSNAGSSTAPFNSSIGFTGFLLSSKRKVKPTKGPEVLPPVLNPMGGRSFGFSGDEPWYDEWQDASDLIDISTLQLRTDEPEVQELMSKSAKIDWSILEQKLNSHGGHRPRNSIAPYRISPTSTSLEQTHRLSHKDRTKGSDLAPTVS
jgi:hypothetical protein